MKKNLLLLVFFSFVAEIDETWLLYTRNKCVGYDVCDYLPHLSEQQQLRLWREWKKKLEI